METMLFIFPQFSGGKRNFHNSISQKKLKTMRCWWKGIGILHLNFRNHSFHEVVQLQIRHTAGISVKWELFLSRHFTRGRKLGRFFLTSSFPSRVYKPLDVSCLNIWFNFYKLWNKGSPINNSPIWGMPFSKLNAKFFISEPV